MQSARMENEGLTGAVPRHHVAAGVAVMVSVLLHALLLRTLPPVYLGRVEHRLPEPREERPLRVERREAPIETTQRPEVFRPRDPGHGALLSADEERFREVLDKALFREPSLTEKPWPGEDTALAAPRPPEWTDGWEPRQQVLKIEERLIREDLAALPRVITPTPPRVALAPDVIFPQDTSALERPPAFWGEEDRTAADLIFARPRPPAGLPSPPETDPGTEPGKPLRAWGDHLSEAAAEVTQLQPVEHMLRLEISAYRQSAEDPVYFRVSINRREHAGALPVLARDVMLLQDTSASISQRLLNECKEGLLRWLEWLAPQDVFNIIAFHDVPVRCFGAPAPASSLHKARARTFLRDLRARGRTDVFASLREVLVASPRRDAPLIVVLVTDGIPTEGIINTSDIIERFTVLNDGQASVFCVGVGGDVNRLLLDMLSYRNRGDSLVVEERRDIAAALDRFAVELHRPVLYDLSFRVAGLPQAQFFPRSLPNLYLDRPLELFGRAPAIEDSMGLHVVGQAGAERYDMVFEIDEASMQEGGEEIRSKWARHRLLDLMAQHLRTGDPDLLHAIQELAGIYGMPIPYGNEHPLR